MPIVSSLCDSSATEKYTNGMVGKQLPRNYLANICLSRLYVLEYNNMDLIVRKLVLKSDLLVK